MSNGNPVFDQECRGSFGFKFGLNGEEIVVRRTKCCAFLQMCRPRPSPSKTRSLSTSLFRHGRTGLPCATRPLACRSPGYATRTSGTDSPEEHAFVPGDDREISRISTRRL
jgi:hypothetical protein